MHRPAPSGANLPGGHGSQLPEALEGTDPGLQTLPHPASPVVVDVEPMVCAGQAVHWLRPARGAKSVAAQGVQLVEPGVAAKRPGGQLEHDARAPSLKVPAGQV